MTYQSSSSSFTTEAVTTDGLTLSGLITFTASGLTTVAGVTDDEYVDSADGIEFFAFGSNGTTHESFTVSDGTLYTSGGDSIEIVFTSPIYGFGFNFTTTFSSGDNLCEGTAEGGGGNCDGNVFISENGSGFMGALNDNPLPAATLPTLWLYPLATAADTDIESYEFGSEASTPEAGTMLTLGSGLVLISLLRRRARRARQGSIVSE